MIRRKWICCFKVLTKEIAWDMSERSVNKEENCELQKSSKVITVF